ncbi:hypothetical protein ABGB12_15045 [Actinocorallia sp. B10E7]|uniref:hypothetical protein n=1 Tax=Actinocorallia sp. B10E7 TaxID=3153558 RepID=UPI00325F3AA7
MKPRGTILLALTVLGLSLIPLASPAAPAWACSCVAGGQDERADLIVIGTVTEVTNTGIRLAVESTEKGSPGEGPTLELKTNRDENTCGYGFRVGTRYRVNSIGGATGLCAGVRRLPDVAPPPPTDSTSAKAEPTPAQSPGWWWLAASATLTVLTLGTTVVLRRRKTG